MGGDTGGVGVRHRPVLVPAPLVGVGERAGGCGGASAWGTLLGPEGTTPAVVVSGIGAVPAPGGGGGGGGCQARPGLSYRLAWWADRWVCLPGRVWWGVGVVGWLLV
jgi:hypothetical protein